MATLHLSIHGFATTSSVHRKFNFSRTSGTALTHLGFSRCKIRAVSTVPGSEPAATEEEKEPNEPPVVDFAFVHSVLLPDGTPDVHFRRACGGQKLRDIMLDNNIELYGPYGRPLLNCAGGGTCGTCMVEVVEGMELLNPRTEKEKEKMKRKPKSWRLACQTTVGKPDSRGMLVIQQLPEWKAHEWTYDKNLPSEEP
ncbi:Photosynthetic NDH subunit of subcomplex B 3 [Hibiscus syriacus]|uniref:Photosynthetic NDH subunit of subcomplex B 3 n=1 Tax=Hibiscus syriacus TaxID=106335 RepID=A0A6A2X323_HIBSY|nr:photosynthetic NDH subunit of subcomplex B 3, chloroplastic-like [Hibiscus syriacus]KAE8662990.1 Photosynthetic NDH subunit of subcomplex B 3 [Hibiscus syriacus]